MELPYSLRRQILQHWAEPFRGVLNRPSTISDAATARLPQVETNADLDLAPSPHETINAVQQLSSGKAPGSEAIPAESYKRGGPQLMEHLTALFQEMCCQVEVPQGFKDATIVHLYRREGNRQICDNHRGIFLLNIAGKVFVLILLKHLEQSALPESQCGFRRHRGTTDMIFATRQLREMCQAIRTLLYSTAPIEAKRRVPGSSLEEDCFKSSRLARRVYFNDDAITIAAATGATTTVTGAAAAATTDSSTVEFDNIHRVPHSKVKQAR
ncbi:hypothetical protein SprV_0401486500 [Sparganum proliferum]